MATKHKAQYKDLPLTSIVIEEQVRTIFEESSIADLADNIRQVGAVLNPITVRPRPSEGENPDPEAPAQYELVAGERRVRAARLAGFTKIPAMIRILTDEQAQDIQLSENLQRKDLTPMEEAVSFRRSVEKMHILPRELAARLAKSLDYVQRRLRLNELIDEAQQWVHQRVIPLHVADLLAPLEDGEQRKMLNYCLVKRYGPGDEAAGRPASYHCKSLVDVRWYLQNAFLLLELAPFSKTVRIPGVDRPACMQCPQRTGYNQTLFHDIVDKDRCLNPGCYRKKITQHYASLAERLQQAEGQPVPFVRTGYDFPTPAKVLDAQALRLVADDAQDPCTRLKPVCVLSKGEEPRVMRACLSARCACRTVVETPAVTGAPVYSFSEREVMALRENYQAREQQQHYTRLLTDTLYDTPAFSSPMSSKLLAIGMARSIGENLALKTAASYGHPVLDDDGTPYVLPTNLNRSRAWELLVRLLDQLEQEQVLQLAWAFLLNSPYAQATDDLYLEMLADEHLPEGQRAQLVKVASQESDQQTAALFTEPDFQPDEKGVVHLSGRLMQQHHLSAPSLPEAASADPVESAP